MEQNTSKTWINNVSQQTLEQFKRAFVQKCIESGSTKLQLKYDELAKICGLSKGAVFKAVEVLAKQGFLERCPAQSRRIANTYILKGPIHLEVPKNTETLTFETGCQLVATVNSIRKRVKDLERENERFRALLSQDCEGTIEIITETDLPGNLKQVIYRVRKDSLDNSI